MKNLAQLVADLRRPRLLIRAARLGVDSYRREKHLGRHFGYGSLPRSSPALLHLLDRENRINQQRESGAAGYSIATHVDLLIAIMGEARLLRASL
uniref:DUF6477 family protein n=1 Tax=Shimia sp. TaxID=1954381 RepID=UPI003567C54A